MNSRKVLVHRCLVGLACGLAAMVFLIGGVARAAGKEECDVLMGLGQVCGLANAVAGAAGKVLTAPFQYAANSAVDMVTGAVAESATWLLGKVVGFIDSSTSPDLTADWFRERYRFMVGLGALVLLPMLMLASVRAVLQQDISQLVRSFFVHLPVAVLGTFLALYFTQTLLTATDALSEAVAKGVAGDVSEIFDSVGSTLSAPVSSAGQPAIPAFAMLIGAFLLVVGSFLVWLELLVRSAAVTVSAFFLPLILATLVWPAIAHWTKRLVQTLVAIILSKFVIVSVMSLATAALSDPGGGGFGTIMGASALMLMSAFSPFALLKLMPLAEGAALSHLEGMGRRPLATMQPGGSINHAMSIMRSKTSGGGGGQLTMAGPKAAAAGGAVGAGAGVAVGAGMAASQVAKGPGKRIENHAPAAGPKEPKEPRTSGGGLGDGSSRPDKNGSGGAR